MNIALVLVGALCVVVNGQLSSHFNTNEAQALVEKARDVISKPKSLKDIHYALNFLKASDHNDFTCQCESLQSLVSKADNGYQIFYGLSSGRACNCEVFAEFSVIARKAAQVSVL